MLHGARRIRHGCALPPVPVIIAAFLFGAVLPFFQLLRSTVAEQTGFTALLVLVGLAFFWAWQIVPGGPMGRLRIYPIAFIAIGAGWLGIAFEALADEQQQRRAVADRSLERSRPSAEAVERYIRQSNAGTPGMTWFRLPLFVWSLYAVSLIMLLATPVLAMTLLLIIAERVFGLPVFDPNRGGDQLLFQHLFWFYSHPAVYIMILPGMGVVSELITCFARRRIFGYSFMVYALVGIAVIGFFVWGHHMFVAGQSAYASIVFSLLSFIIAVPSAIKVFNWTATLYGGRIRFPAPMLYALGFIGLFTIGGLTGIFVASIPVDIHVHDTYFIVAHFHYIMVGGMVTAFFGGLHFWWPKATGRLYNERWGQITAMLMFLGFNFTFFPQFILGYVGMPRRYHAYLPEFQVRHVLSSAGAVILAAAYILPLGYLGWSLFRGERAGPNPWDALGLEWETSSPPPQHSFTSPPRVAPVPYDYHPEDEAPRAR